MTNTIADTAISLAVTSRDLDQIALCFDRADSAFHTGAHALAGMHADNTITQMMRAPRDRGAQALTAEFKTAAASA